MVNKGIEASALGSIYTEAIAFIVVFGVMSIVSILISKKNAKKYEKENSLEDRKNAKKEEAIKNLHGDRTDKILKLSHMLKDGLIDKEEFEMLKKEIFA